jgi:hypothetical protein
MTNQQRENHDEELDKILNKAFDDIRKKVNTLMSKREKKFLRDMKSKKPQPQEQEQQPKNKGKNDKKKNYHRSKSSSSGSTSD